MTVPMHRVGAGLYVLWGILHVAIGAQILYSALAKGSSGVLDGLETGEGEVPAGIEGATTGLFAQNAWNILWFGLFAIVVAAKWNWNNSRAGYFANLAVVSLADIGFIVFVLAPGHISLAMGIGGPILWVLAAIFSTLGIRGASAPATPSTA